MNEKELLQTALRYEISMSFLNGLLNDGKLKKDEFDRATKFVADKYDIDNVEIELGKLQYANLQIKESASHEELVDAPATEKTEVQYVSLTDIAKKFSDDAPSYVIQSWMRSRNTLEFLKLWEQRHNVQFIVEGYKMLMDKLNSGTFTMTPKQWVAHTGATGISTKPGKNGGTYAHPLLVCEFMMWLDPEYKLNLLEIRNTSQLIY